jgi:hypothetical protein
LQEPHARGIAARRACRGGVDAPRTRLIFLRDGKGAVTAFVDRREGLDIRWTKSD